jgi:hypothetical protein
MAAEGLQPPSPCNFDTSIRTAAEGSHVPLYSNILIFTYALSVFASNAPYCYSLYDDNGVFEPAAEGSP